MTIPVPEIWTRSAFARAHRLDVYDRAQFVLRDITPGSWVIEGVPLMFRTPAGALVENPAFDDLEPGGGIIVWYGSGTYRKIVFSGPIEQVIETEEVIDEASGSTWVVKTISGSSDLSFVTDRLAHPHPSDLDFTAAATKSYVGAAETVLKSLVSDNLGAAADSTRRLANFTVATDQARGSTVTDAVRLDPLADLVAGWSIRGGVFPTVTPSAGSLVFDVGVGTDRTHSLVLAAARGNVTRIKRVATAPDLTFEWVGGQGVGTARTFRSAESTAAAAVWGRRREAFHDRRDTADTAVLAAQATSDLQAKATNTAVQVEPLDLATLRFGQHYNLGDTCTVVTQSGLTITKAIREIRIETDGTDQTTITPTISDPLTPGVDDLFVFERVRVLEDEQTSTSAAT